jgi:hypothetical protein
MFGSYPGLIAACHVLRRLLAPRHPPYALNNLAVDARARYGVSKVLSRLRFLFALPLLPSGHKKTGF